MAQLTRAKNPELIYGVTNPESILRSIRKDAKPSGQEHLHGDDEHSFIKGQAEDGNRPEHSLREKSTTHEAARARKGPAATHFGKAYRAFHEPDHHARLSGVETTCDKAFLNSRNRKDPPVAEVTGKTVIDAMEMYAVNAQDGPVRSTILLAVRLLIRNILDRRAVADHMQRVANRAVGYLSMIKTVSDTLPKDDDHMVPIAAIVSNYAKKVPNRVKKEGELTGSRRRLRELLPSHPTSDPSDDDDIPSSEKMNRRLRRDKKTTKTLCTPTSSFKGDA